MKFQERLKVLATQPSPTQRSPARVSTGLLEKPARHLTGFYRRTAVRSIGERGLQLEFATGDVKFIPQRKVGGL